MRLRPYPTDLCLSKWSAAFSQTLATYNPDATIADVTNTCIFPSEPYLNCQGACLNDADGDGTCDEQEVPGCDRSQAAETTILLPQMTMALASRVSARLSDPVGYQL